MADGTESSTLVQASPERVLAVIADFGSYAQWTGAVKDAEVLDPGTSGRAEKVRFVLDAGAIKDTYTLAYTWQVAPSGTGRVQWHLVEAEQLLTALDGSYTLEGDAQGPTTVTYRLTVDLRIPMLGLLKRQAEKRIISTALAELKKRVEG